jgi:hypothetical protein
MTERKQERKRDKKIKVDKLMMSKETLQDLTDTQAERVEGGAAAENCSKRLTYYDGC